MSRLNRKLDIWEQNNLIAPGQKQKILDFEMQNTKPHLFYAVSMLGIFVFALGVISLIAANWDDIGDSIKLAADFIILAGITAGIALAEKRQRLFWREAGVFFLFMMTGASIGLIAQIFQTNGTFENATLLWALFTAPLLVVSNKKLLPLFWVPLLLFGLLCREAFWEILDDIRLFMEKYISSEPAVFYLPFLLFCGLLATAFSRLNRLCRQNCPVFAVLRGYCEFTAYCLAFFLLCDGGSRPFSIILELIVSVAVFATAAAVYYHRNARKMLNFNISMIGVCFVLAYIRIFEDLLTTGAGLLISGLVILAAAAAIKTIINKTAKTRKEVK